MPVTNLVHGHGGNGSTRSGTYCSWDHMIQRCTNPRQKQYKDYGGRGITVCDRWRKSFADFLEDMGPRPAGLTLERVDNAKGYYPGNCEWRSRKQQLRNMRRNALFTVRGETGCLSDMAERYGISEDTVHARIHRFGWDVERAFTQRPQLQRRVSRRLQPPRRPFSQSL